MSIPARKNQGKAAMAGAPTLGASPRRKRATVGISPAPSRGPQSLTAFSGDSSEIIRTMRSGTPAEVIPGLAARIGISQDGLSLLDTEVGYELVLDTLGRIEYGIVS